MNYAELQELSEKHRFVGYTTKLSRSTGTRSLSLNSDKLSLLRAARRQRVKRGFAELGTLYHPKRKSVKKYSPFSIFVFLSCSNHEKPPFSLKLEVMRISPEKISTKNIKN